MKTEDLAWMSTEKSTLRLHLHIQPGAKRTEISGVHGERLKVRVQSPPVDGKANQAICQFFAELFEVKKTSVQVISGQASRTKTIEIEGATEARAKLILAAFL